VRRHLVVVLIAAGTAAGCGGGGGSRAAKTGTSRTAAPPTPDEQLVALPRSAVRRCAALATRRDVPVLCPTRLPQARWFVRYQTLANRRSEYLTDLETKPHGSGDPFHVLAGGRRGRFSLKTTADGHWPVDAPVPSSTCCATPRDLGLIGAKRATAPGTWEPVRLKLRRSTSVARHPALLLVVAGYPDGGIHGGHLAVVWNQGDNGYVLSMHFAEHSKYTPREQEALLLNAATAMSGFAAPGGSHPMPNGAAALNSASGCPRTPGGRNAPKVAITLGDGPAYPVLGMTAPPPAHGGVANLDSDLRTHGFIGHKTLWAVSPNAPRDLVVRARKLRSRQPVRFLYGYRTPIVHQTLRLPQPEGNGATP
jgi:hypothetical protein